jgi:hypothetical protein
MCHEIFHLKFNNVHILVSNLDMLYSLRPKLLEYFDWNTNIKESMKNL